MQREHRLTKERQRIEQSKATQQTITDENANSDEDSDDSSDGTEDGAFDAMDTQPQPSISGFKA